MEKGIETEEDNLYKATEDVADNVLDKLSDISPDFNFKGRSGNNSINVNIDYNKMAQAIAGALTNCKFTLDEDGFARIVKDELYKVV